MKVLVLNAGSSSYKAALYTITAPSEMPSSPLWEGKVAWQHPESMKGEVSLQAGGRAARTVEAITPAAAIQKLLDALWEGETPPLAPNESVDAVGHRVVHGGEKYEAPTLLTPEVKADIEAFVSLAPLHNRAALEGIQATELRFANTPQIAVFDTAFHNTMPDEVALYPGPYIWKELGLRRYGFHGISHSYVAQRAAQILHRDLASLRLITCHLGNGCSLAAIREGRSLATTMGFTPLEGLMMGTRSGSVDPGLLLYLLKSGTYTVEALEEELERHSGLLGISGLTHSMREIEEAAHKGHPRAQLALRMFIQRLRWHIGALTAVLEGLDALVFTGGIGENSAFVRAQTCKALRFLGVLLDEAKNAAPTLDRDISIPHAPVPVLVIKTQEEWAIAQACWHLLRETPGTKSAS